MNTKKFFIFIGFLAAIILFLSHEGWTQPKPGTNAPIITHAYAIDEGTIWKYLETLYRGR